MTPKTLMHVVIDPNSGANIGALRTALEGVGQVPAYPQGAGSFYVWAPGKTLDDLRSVISGQIGGTGNFVIQAVDQTNSIFPNTLTEWLNRTTKAA